MLSRIISNKRVSLSLLALPGIVHLILFSYIPLSGNIIAFQDYNLFLGIWDSKWVGFTHFVNMFSYEEFFQIVRNTLLLSFYSILFGFPAPLILALMLNEMRMMWLKRPVQTMLYLPHFLSWVIVAGIFLDLLHVDGIANKFLSVFGVGPIDFVTNPAYFRGMIVSIGIWKEVGWGMIIYLAALTAINPSLYEAAMVDGAGRWRRMWNISIPAILPAIVVLLLLRIGQVFDTNVEQVLVFLNPLVRDVGEIIDTYIYRVGLLNGQFSYTTAFGLFKSVVGFTMIVVMNQLSRKLTGESIY